MLDDFFSLKELARRDSNAKKKQTKQTNFSTSNGAFTLSDSDSDKVSDSNNITVDSYGHPHQHRKQKRNRIGQCEHTVGPVISVFHSKIFLTNIRKVINF